MSRIYTDVKVINIYDNTDRLWTNPRWGTVIKENGNTSTLAYDNSYHGRNFLWNLYSMLIENNISANIITQCNGSSDRGYPWNMTLNFTLNNIDTHSFRIQQFSNQNTPRYYFVWGMKFNSVDLAITPQTPSSPGDQYYMESGLDFKGTVLYGSGSGSIITDYLSTQLAAQLVIDDTDDLVWLLLKNNENRTNLYGIGKLGTNDEYCLTFNPQIPTSNGGASTFIVYHDNTQSDSKLGGFDFNSNISPNTQTKAIAVPVFAHSISYADGSTLEPKIYCAVKSDELLVTSTSPGYREGTRFANGSYLIAYSTTSSNSGVAFLIKWGGNSVASVFD